MLIDLILLLILGVFFYSGFQRGFIYQIVRLGLLIAGYIAARALHPHLGFLMDGVAGDIPPEFRGLLTMIAIFLVVYLVGGMILGHVLRRFHSEHKVVGKMDRLAGGLLGVVKVGLVVYLLLCFGLALAPMVGADTTKTAKSSHALRFVRDHNLLYGETSVYFRGVRALMVVAKDPGKRAKLLEDPEVRGFLKVECQALLEDEELQARVREGDWPTLLRDPRILRIIRDPRFYAALDRMNLRDQPMPTPKKEGEEVETGWEHLLE